MNEQQRKRLDKMLLELTVAQDSVTHANECNTGEVQVLIFYRDDVRAQIVAFVEQLIAEAK